MKIAPSTYYAARGRPPSHPAQRVQRDEEFKAEITRVHQENYGVSGMRKVHAQLVREGIALHGCCSSSPDGLIGPPTSAVRDSPPGSLFHDPRTCKV